MSKVHLICNAHLDPVWLWQWDEGAAETLSTFRIAAEFCEEYDGFVFNHNEAILYQWIEEYDLCLFERIQGLVKQGKWHIMGGWFLQPDCNLPAGESFVRQALIGRHYFKEKFGVVSTTAINFDSFGHTRGLVQILKKSGFNSYIICRSGRARSEVKSKDFKWVGYDGSEVIVHKSDENYNSVWGKVSSELEGWLEKNGDAELSLYLWGVGNHGGGPSKEDVENLSVLKEKLAGKHEIVHSNPEDYFNALAPQSDSLPSYSKALNPVASGCYTSQIRIKQLHRKLENEFYSVEKMLSNASLQGYMNYPKKEMDEALYDLMSSEFHDALPGSGTKAVEDDTIRMLHHGLEIVSRLKTKAFFALSSGQDKVTIGEIPILVYNPHPFKVKGIFECEFVLPKQNWNDEFSYPVIYQGDKRIPCQAEQELAHFKMDWRKNGIFEAELEPGQMNRFDCKFEILKKKPDPELKEVGGKFKFNNGHIEVEVNCETGLIDKYIVQGKEYLDKNSFLPLIVNDNLNSWGHSSSYRDVVEEFKLLSREEGSKFSGLPGKSLKSVRVIEDGAVRTIIEAVFSSERSYIVQRYYLPKKGSEIRIDVQVYWNEKDKMLKLSVPTKLQDSKYIGQTAYGFEELYNNGEEVVSQKWVTVVSQKDDKILSCINDCIHGSDFIYGEMRLTLLRSAGYAATAVPDDRFTDRMDTGERYFSFWINAGTQNERLKGIDREALIHNEKPHALSYCPSGNGNKPELFMTLSDQSVQLSTFKKAERSDDYIIRLFDPTGQKRKTIITIPAMGIIQEVSLNKFEIKTYKLKVESKKLVEFNLMEIE